jgi:hypothetical protein
MPPGDKIYLHYLFRPYVQTDEHLLWVGEPQKNRYLGLQPKPQILKKLIFTHWRVPLIYALLYPFTPINLSALPFGDYLFLLDILWLVSSIALVWFLISSIFRIGKEYYAISTKRLLVMRRMLWNRVNAAPLGLLPEFRLDSQANKSLSIRFAPMRIEEKKFRGRIIQIEHHRPDLVALSREEAQTAYRFLQNSKNAILDQRAREIGLLK